MQQSRTERSCEPVGPTSRGTPLETPVSRSVLRSRLVFTQISVRDPLHLMEQSHRLAGHNVLCFGQLHDRHVLRDLQPRRYLMSGVATVPMSLW